MAEAAAKEPSMEDILSSIRKIIADEEAPTESASNPSANTAQQDNNATVNVEHEAIRTTSVEKTEEITTISQAAMKSAEADKLSPQPSIVATTASNVDASGLDTVKVTNSLAGVAESVRSKVAQEINAIAPTVEARPEVSVEQEKPPVTTSVAVEETLAIKRVEMPEAKPASTPQIEVPVLQSAVSEQAPAEAEVNDEAAAFKGALMSPSVDGVVSSAFDRLKRSAMDDIDAKTEAILRPMLREWLDENLPVLVERLVREEIERVARG